MRLLFLAGDLTTTSGWGTYCNGFLARARAVHGDDAVACPPLASLDRSWRWRELGTPRDLARLVRLARGSALIHALVEPAAPLALALATLARCRFVVSAHGTYADLAAYPRRQRAAIRFAFRRAAAILPVSSYTATVARRSFGDVPIAVVPGGFTPPPLRPQARTTTSEVPRLLSVGVLKERKGFHTLLVAIARLHARGVRVACDIVGPIPSKAYRARLDGLVRDHDLGADVSIRGVVSADELAALYAGADLFVLASEHVGPAFEGLGLVYLEALSYGVPVIGSHDSGAIDVIRDGVNGLLVTPGSPEALASAIARILGDASLAGAMRSVAPDSARGFTWDEVGTRMNAVWTAHAR
ncbi:MAG TPA: glycosyltransferase family 4 protein [Acidimicrobiia bacterium]|jgi:glycosyltransferase involved in cell wall biosynthesis|nr:glycosyltransferase family 4 protein [Acidimicrobiia bacterium]